MKLTKLMVLALVLALFVCAFVACGGTTDTETQAPETQAPETQAPDSETEAPGGDTEAECTHEIVVDEKAATCSDRGYKKETCKLCGEVISETAYPKTAHTASGAATCDTDSKCTVCGEVLEAAKGHVWGEVTTTAATCTAAGKETKTCTVCNKTDVKELATLAHDIAEATEYVPATCTTEGSKTGVCSLCGQTQTVVLPAAHVVTDLGDLSALTFVDGKIQAKCTACEAVVDVTAEVRFALSFDEADVPTELAKYGDGFNYLLVYNGDQAGTVQYPPVVTAYPDATDGHTSVLTTKHNSSPAITFKGELLADADYYVISFDWRATKYGNNTNKIGAFGQAAKAFEGVAGEGDMVYAFKVDRSNGDLYDHSGKNKFGSASAEQWYKVIVVVDNASGTAYTYVDGVCVATTQNAKWQVVEGGEYTWRFGGIYNVFHVPEFDNFEVVAIQKSVTEVGPSVDSGDGEEGNEEDDGTGCAHQCYLEYQLPTPTSAGFIKRTCLICGRIVTFEVLDHIHTPDVEADCVTDSKCTECGVIIEAAWGHNFDGEPVVTPADPACSAPGTVVGKCTVCGDVVSEVEPAAHTFKVADLDLANLTFDENGNVVAKCSVCGQTGAISAEEVFALTFDTFAPDFTDQTGGNAAEVTSGRLSLPGNQCAFYKFDASLLNSADVYVISFDYRRDSTNTTATGKHGVLGLVRVDANNTMPDKWNYALKIERGTFKYASGGTGSNDGTIPANAVVATNSTTALDKITIVVDNANGYSYVYINGSFYCVNETPNMLATVENCGEGYTYAWRFGGQYNLNIGQQYDNFTVTVLDAECRHSTTIPVITSEATCTSTGTAMTICAKCGVALGSETVDMLPHEASTVVISDLDCATVFECVGCGDLNPVTVAKANAVHTVPAPTSFDNNTVVKDGKVQGICTVCGLTADADIAEDVRVALDFDKADLATEIAEKNAAYNTQFGTTDVVYLRENPGVGKNSVYASYAYGNGGPTVFRGRQVDSSAQTFIEYNGSLFADASYYMISFDWRFTQGGQPGEAVVFTAYGESGANGASTSFGANICKFNREENIFNNGVTYPTDGTTLVKNEWYHFTVIVNASTGKAYTFINDTYAGTVSSSFFKPAESTYRNWRFGDTGFGHLAEYDNFKVSVLTKAPVLE